MKMPKLFNKKKKGKGKKIEIENEEVKKTIDIAPPVISYSDSFSAVSSFKELDVIAENNKLIERKEIMFQQQLYILLKAIQAVNTQEVKTLLEQNPMLANGIYQNKFTPLYIAVHVGEYDIVRALLDYGANVNTGLNQNNEDITWEIVKENKLEFLDDVLDRVSNINFVDYLGQTRLFQAVKLSNYSAVEAYLMRGIDINKQDKDGKTALHWNLFRREFKEADERIFKLLLGAGAKYEIIDKRGLPPYAYATLYDPMLTQISSLVNINFFAHPDYAKIIVAEYDREYPLPLDEKKHHLPEHSVGFVTTPKRMPRLGGR